MASRPRQLAQVFSPSVPAPFRDGFFAHEDSDKPKRQDAAEPQAFKDFGGRLEARGTNQFRNQKTTASGFLWQVLGPRLVVPVEQRQEIPVTVGSEPCASRRFAGIQRFDAVPRVGARPPGNRTISKLIPIHRRQVAVRRWNERERAHEVSVGDGELNRFPCAGIPVPKNREGRGRLVPAVAIGRANAIGERPLPIQRGVRGPQGIALVVDICGFGRGSIEFHNGEGFAGPQLFVTFVPDVITANKKAG